MAKTNETANDTAKPLWRVNFQYIAPNALLRQGSIIIEGKDSNEATETATERLKDMPNFKGARITVVKKF